MTGEPPGFPEMFAVLRRSRTLVLVTLGVSLAAGIIVAFALPARYRAVAIMLPPDERGLPPLTRAERESLAAGSPAPGPLDLLETPAGLAARLITSAPVVDLAWRSLASGTAGRPPDALAGGARAWVTDQKVVYVEVESADPAFAAAGANALIGALNDYNVARRHAMARALADSLEAATHRAAADTSAAGRAIMATLAAETARAKRDEVDPRPAVEVLEPASPPARPATPVRGAVVACFVLAGALGATLGAFLRDAMRARGPR